LPFGNASKNRSWWPPCGAPARITVGHLEAEQFLVELLRFGKVVRKEHHVAHFHRFRAFINRRRLIYAQRLAPHVRRRAVRFEFPLTRHFNADRHTVRVDAPHGVVVFEMTSLTGEAATQRVEFGACRHTPRHLAQRRTFLEGGRQRRIIRVDDKYRAAIQRFKAGAGFVVRSLFQTPVSEKAPAGFEVRYTVGNLFNTENRHIVPRAP
jgi:hypothetical protein